MTRFLEREAAALPVPDDWVYVNNFSLPHQPNVIRFPPGRACEFRRDMEKLIVDLQAAITLAFESEEYETHRREIAQQVGERSGDPAGWAAGGGREDRLRHGPHTCRPRLRPQDGRGRDDVARTIQRVAHRKAEDDR